MEQWDKLASRYGLTVLSQKYILWPNLTKRLTPIFRNTSVLDIGCGNGIYSHYFHESGARVVGLDSSEEQIKLAKKINSGPSYVIGKIQDYLSSSPFDNLFANMVICNIPNERELAEFFQKTMENSHLKSRLFVTDVSPRFKKICETVSLIHRYPEHILEGTEFSVQLPTEKGEMIGPFTNYHWSKSKLISLANSQGWKLTKSRLLKTVNEDKLDWPTYALYEFDRKD